MKFFPRQGSMKCESGTIEYIVKDYSFDSTPILNSLPAILICNINLTFDCKDKTANDVWGYHSYYIWKKAKLIPPQSFCGKLFISSDIEKDDIRRLIECYEWNTYYDDYNGWVCIGNVTEYDGAFMAVEFYPNVVAVVKEDNLIALWIKPRIIGNLILREC